VEHAEYDYHGRPWGDSTTEEESSEEDHEEEDTEKVHCDAEATPVVAQR
jgi:hypothetical protein